MSMASALRGHQQNWDRMQANTYTGVEAERDANIDKFNLEQRSQNVVMDKARMDDATTRRGQNLGLAGDLARPRSTGLEGLSSLLDGLNNSGALSGMQSSLPPVLIDMGNQGLATAGARPVLGSYKTGGLIDGPPPPPDGSDNVDIKAKAGEYVLPPEAVQVLGLDFLDRIVQLSTGHPPVHGGTPTDEGKPGFWSGGGVEDLAAQQRRAMQAAATAAPNATPKFWSPGTKQGLEAVEPPTQADTSPKAVAGAIRERFGNPPSLLPPTSPREAGERMASGSVRVNRALGDTGRAMIGGLATLGEGMVDNQFTRGFAGKPEPEPKTKQPASAPSAIPASRAPTGASLPANPNDDPKAREYFAGPGDNVVAHPTVKGVYVNEFKPGSADYNEYGKAIFSDSFRGATKRGFDQDFAKTGNYAGDPATGRGVSLPKGLSSLNRPETNAAMMAYGPARQAGLESMRDNANLEIMRQWQGQDLARAPDEVRELFGQAPSMETSIDRYLADTLSPQGQAQRAQHETQLAALKAAGRGRNQTDSTAKIPGQMMDHFLKLNQDTDPARSKMALTIAMPYTRTMQQLGMSDAEMATVTTDLLNAVDGLTLSKDESKGLNDQQQLQALALKQRTEYERQLRMRLGLQTQ